MYHRNTTLKFIIMEQNNNIGIYSESSNTYAIAHVLNKWRTEHGYSLYAIAKFENMRIEALQHIEQGYGNIASLMNYFDFIANHDRPFLDDVLNQWRIGLGVEIG